MHDPSELAAAAAHSEATVFRACGDTDLDLFDLTVKVGGRSLPVPRALYELAIRVAQGDFGAAECIARDCIDATRIALAPWAEEEAERLERAAANADDAEEAFFVAQDKAIRAFRNDPGPGLFWGAI